MSEIQSKPYQPDPRQCCEACVFGTGSHPHWCPVFRAYFQELEHPDTEDEYVEAA